MGGARSIGVASGFGIVLAVLLIATVALDSTLEATTDDSFCLSCHEMAVNIGGEFEHRLRLPESEERHAGCAQCHLPQELIPRLRRKLRAGRELYHHLIGTLATPERFEARRMEMARSVWRDLRRNGSGECTVCHDGGDGAGDHGAGDRDEKVAQSATARLYHERAAAADVTCIDCHKGTAHALGPLPRELGHGDEASCLRCHEPERVEAIWRISHSDPAGVAETPPNEECGDCHGVGSSHVRFPLDRQGQRPGRGSMPLASESHACIECHREGPRVEWDVRAHGLTEAACRSCHRIHLDEDAAPPAVGRGAACADSCHILIDERDDERDDETVAEAAAATSVETSCVSCHDPHLPPETSRCESCHPMGPAALAGQPAEARGFHERGERQQLDCGECHKGIIHKSTHAELKDATPATL